MSKMIKTPFFGHGDRVKELLALVYSDVCGPMITQAKGGYSYFITFMDDLSRFGYVYLLKYKFEALISSKSIKVWSRNKLKKVSQFFDLIKKESTFLVNFLIILKIMVFSLNGSLFIHHS